mmetsp:Transcript_10469/g.17570  ORF Transcript_10469/g.17570 Transcript_10469/m.17570 type:complete len:90 (-) Transcript_10469:251-520(-)
MSTPNTLQVVGHQHQCKRFNQPNDSTCCSFVPAIPLGHQTQKTSVLGGIYKQWGVSHGGTTIGSFVKLSQALTVIRHVAYLVTATAITP